MRLPWRLLSSVAAASALAIGLASCGDSSGTRPTLAEKTFVNALGTNGHIGGSIDRIARFEDGGITWVAYNVGSSLVTTPPGNGDVLAPRHRLDLAGVIEDIQIVMNGSQRLAIVAMGRSGVAAVDLTNPAAPNLIADGRVELDYNAGITSDTGGNTDEEYLIFGPGQIVATASDGDSVWLADERYGIHKIALSTLLDPAARGEGNTLSFTQEIFTLTIPHEDTQWGTPTDLRLHEGKLFATLGVLGLGIYDPATLEKVGGYNLYLDTSMTESRFYGADVATLVQGAGYLDAATGMPNYKQAAFELRDVLRDGVSAPTPWYDLARGGQFFYSALSLDIASFNGRTIAYLAYGNAGLVAVDVTGFDTATGAAPLTASYLAYVPAVMPAGKGEGDERKEDDRKGLWAFQGVEHYGETGAKRVTVHGTQVWISDHLGGVIAVRGADDPAANWHGPAGKGNYDNDDDGIRNQSPAWEFVTSFDMTAVGSGGVFVEPLPAWLYDPAGPAVLATGEAGTGHGVATLVMPNAELDKAGTLDLVLATQAYGLSYVDITNLAAPNMTDRYAVIGSVGGVDAKRINVDGKATGLVDLSETTGMYASRNHLYVADAPHGVYAFRIRGSDGRFLDVPEFAGATLPGLVASNSIDGIDIYPIHHAKDVLFDARNKTVLVSSGGWGLRRGDVSAVENGQASLANPALITVRVEDLFEHKTTFHAGSNKVNGPDRAFDVAVKDNLAYVADGTQGLTIYDLNRVPGVDPDFLVSNLGGGSGGGGGSGSGGGSDGPKAKAYSIDLWSDTKSGKTYAFMAVNRAGIAVVDVTTPASPQYVKVFQPFMEQEAGKIGAADGTGLAVKVLRDHVVLGYGSFGAVVYRIADLIEPLPEGVDPQKLWDRTGSFDYRPLTVSEFRLWEIPGYEHIEEIDGTVQGLALEQDRGGDVVWMAHGVGVARVNYTDPANPKLLQWIDMTGEISSVHYADGRAYVGASRGGLWILK